MAQSALQRWSLAEFFAWQEHQPDRYEFVGGLPLRMMAGASNRHDRIVLNLLVILATRLRGSNCVPFTGNSSVETYPGQIRRPDAGVDCGLRDPDGFKATEPRLVAEVLSPSTRDFDTAEKVAEYKSVGSIEHILVIESNYAEAILWSRGPNLRWERCRYEGSDATVPLPKLDLSLALTDVYEGVTFPDIRPVLSLQ